MQRKYEGMFLFDPTVAGEWDAIQEEVRRLMERAGARIIVSQKWDDRRLAYEIRGRKRGIYVLTYFEADSGKIADLERDARLSESILRTLILSAEHMTEQDMHEAAARPAGQPITGPLADEDSGEEGERRGGRDRDRGPRRDREDDRRPRPRDEGAPAGETSEAAR